MSCQRDRLAGSVTPTSEKPALTDVPSCDDRDPGADDEPDALDQARAEAQQLPLSALSVVGVAWKNRLDQVRRAVCHPPAITRSHDLHQHGR